jgi:hypothetical protein
MNVYHFNPGTGEYEGQEQAQIDPLESKLQGKPVYLLPANATFTPPPGAGKNTVLVWQGGVWNILPDHRGAKYWDADGEHQITEIGDTIPDGVARQPPPSSDYLLRNGQWTLDIERVRSKTWRRLEADMHRYIFETRDYPQPTQITLQAIYVDPSSSDAQRAACKEIFDWVKGTVLAYYYEIKLEIMRSEDPEGISWDFIARCDVSAPFHTLAKIIQM